MTEVQSTTNSSSTGDRHTEEDAAAQLAVAEEQKLPKRQTPFSQAFVDFIPTGWAPYDTAPEQQLDSVPSATAHRDALAARFPGERLVIPAGTLVRRNNDCDYPFRPNSAFAYYTGLGTDREPNAVLIVDGSVESRDVLYFKPRAPRTDREFYADPTYGEMWVGKRESLAEMSAMTGLECHDISRLQEAVSASDPQVRVIRDADPGITETVDSLRSTGSEEADQELYEATSAARFCKDQWEIGQLRQACRKSKVGFEAMIEQIPAAVANGRGERWLEGTFNLHARHLGNNVGYGSICAAGDNANTLHWMRNDGDLRPGELVLIDAGIEVDSLYTADITRTLPVSGRFSPAQRKVYQAVLEAQDAAAAVARVGHDHREIHQAAIRVICEYLAEWGILPVSVDEALSPEGGQFRRWMVHGTSHHLGLDVHDCSEAARKDYSGPLKAGMTVSDEPGIYFKKSDLLVPEEFRGIGIRIEDDILITDGDCEWLSKDTPRQIDEVEDWMAEIWGRSTK
ncbi:aminopeptidase P family protein [Acidipropionibacterium jensenii]|uniref:aminopeptidase P family protein n=1 Tax=Acidipropionibacterium jensenii TaxID=1749 RepID=UPI0026476A32|nr:aminopeptidase P family protein [Acidipropionibacterium jensenii]MDN5977217.1 aminopeptidase P family protein [Acidipropionibacterium jensenii]MDN5997227.1 aminopeptidase P family protein [Acidipropionibacterium jensenii]MDN6427106.1 aminopeptidase P family protein [Acidipropionibacterium jensenii]MDN6441658.1 aminopeptidase P family protein [Acidipropionibacterium jensenii]MDN6479877.1 aminopeptidase P family protein [Acidipropionibacterium jensenii]